MKRSRVVSIFIVLILLFSSAVVLDKLGIEIVENVAGAYCTIQNQTMYWSFSGEVNISIWDTGEDPVSADNYTITVYNDDHENVTQNLTISKFDGYCHINSDSWGIDSSSGFVYGNNGTWSADISHVDGSWECTGTWRVKSAPKVLWRWVDDDGAVWDDANYDEIIPYIPAAADVPLDVQFEILDSDENTFGDLISGQGSGLCKTLTQCAENITISGNSLFTGKLSDFPGFAENTYWYSSGIWHVPIIPTMDVGGGSITFRVTAYNSSVSRTISIGGMNYAQNGSVVAVSPNDFMIDMENKTLSVTARFADDGGDIQTATIILYYIDDTYTGSIDGICAPIVAHAVAWTSTYSGGYYTIPFNITQQTFNQTFGAGFAEIKAPRNLTVFVDGPGHRDGYGLIQMKKANDLETHISQDTFMAGFEYDNIIISCDFVGDSTETPSANIIDKNNFHMKIIDENGKDVTGTSNSDNLLHNIYASLLTGEDAYSFEFNDVYGIESGTYHIYAWNNTHNSIGNNATFTIQPVEVTCDKAPFIWMSDKNISATFTITYDGNPVNGSLVIDNMSDVGTYNKTWTNCSFDGNSDTGGNTSIKIDDTEIINGVVTVNDITANYLAPGEINQYITFWFKPADSPGAFARAKEGIEVEVPTVTPDPQYIPLGRPTDVCCTATGRGVPLSDVFIRLHGQGFDQNSTTDVDGCVTFSIMPVSTGNISIDVGEIGRTLPDTVVYVVAWVIDASCVSEINEGEQFTVTAVKEGTTDPVVGATVSIPGIGTETTDDNGQATFTAPEVTSDKSYIITVTAEGYIPDELIITVINVPRLVLYVDSPVEVESTFEVIVAKDTGEAVIGAIVSFNGEIYITGGGGVAILSAPDTIGDYIISASFGNYIDVTATVTVVNAEPPFVKIIQPEKALYLYNEIVSSFFITLILGDIDIIVNADDLSGIERVDFYIGTHRLALIT